MANDIFVISDLHLGDGGPRDNFAHDNKLYKFNSFLDYVEKEKGRLYILGDLFDFWQAHIGKSIKTYISLLDRMADFNPIYLIGNHDADLEQLIGMDMFTHPIFSNMTGPFIEKIGDKDVKFIHGHELDVMYQKNGPGWGDIISILGGIIEDKKGSPLLSAGGFNEKMLLKTGRSFMWLWDKVMNSVEKTRNTSTHPHDFEMELTPAQDPKKTRGLLSLYKKDHSLNKYNILVAGHTHSAKTLKDWYFNSGCWVGSRQNYIRITKDCQINIYSWKDKPELIV